MRDYDIDRMVEALHEMRVITSKAAAKNAIKNYWTDRVALVWTLDDIQNTAKWLSKEQAHDVLHRLDDIDADLGVNWDRIYALAERLYPRPENFEE